MFGLAFSVVLTLLCIVLAGAQVLQNLREREQPTKATRLRLAALLLGLGTKLFRWLGKRKSAVLDRAARLFDGSARTAKTRSPPTDPASEASTSPLDQNGHAAESARFGVTPSKARLRIISIVLTILLGCLSNILSSLFQMNTIAFCLLIIGIFILFITLLIWVELHQEGAPIGKKTLLGLKAGASIGVGIAILGGSWLILHLVFLSEPVLTVEPSPTAIVEPTPGINTTHPLNGAVPPAVSDSPVVEPPSRIAVNVTPKATSVPISTLPADATQVSTASPVPEAWPSTTETTTPDTAPTSTVTTVRPFKPTSVSTALPESTPTQTQPPTHTTMPIQTPIAPPVQSPTNTSTATFMPSAVPTTVVTDVPTVLPSPFATPTQIPTETRMPTATSTQAPTDTPLPTWTPTAKPTSTSTPTPTFTDTPMPTATTAPPCPGFAQFVVVAEGVQHDNESLCRPDGQVAEIGLVTRAEVVLDMGDSHQIVDHAGIDFYFYEFAEESGIQLDPIEIAVAPDNGTGRPGDFREVFVWGDNDLSNNGTIPPRYRPEIPRRFIESADLHNDTGIGIDIGLGDGQHYRFVRIRTHPPSAVRPPGKRTQVDAIEISK